MKCEIFKQVIKEVIWKQCGNAGLILKKLLTQSQLSKATWLKEIRHIQKAKTWLKEKMH